MYTNIKKKKEAIDVIEKGADKYADPISYTLGPRGRTAIIELPNGQIKISKDGMTLADAITLEDKSENAIAKLGRKVAQQTFDDVGDNKTTAIILWREFLKKGIEHIRIGKCPVSIKKGIDKGIKVVVEELSRISKEVKGKDILNVASISANNKELGTLVAKVINKVGVDGKVTVEEMSEKGIKIVQEKGMEIDSGYGSPYFITNEDKMSGIIEEAYILTTDMVLKSNEDILPILNKLQAFGKKNLVIIAKSIEGVALATLEKNVTECVFNIIGISIGHTEQRKQLLHDVAVITGARVISEGKETMDMLEIDDFGQARKVISKKDSTTFVDGDGIKENINNRIELLKQNTDDDNREELELRVAKLSGGIAVIKVGSTTTTEAQETIDRIEDSLFTTKASIEEGIVAGGGVAFLRASKVLEDIELNKDEQIGIDILKDVLTKPLRQIAYNAGQDENVVLNKVNELKLGEGYNADINKYEDLIKAGIVDATKGMRSALENSASIATLMLISASIMTIEDVEKEL